MIVDINLVKSEEKLINMPNITDPVLKMEVVASLTRLSLNLVKDMVKECFIDVDISDEDALDYIFMASRKEVMDEESFIRMIGAWEAILLKKYKGNGNE